MAQIAIIRSHARRALRRGLLGYGSPAALAAAMMLAGGALSPVQAQDIGPRMAPNESVQGSFTSTAPSPPRFESRSPTLDTIRLASDAVLNWTPYDNQPLGGTNGNSFVNFLPPGTELRFLGGGTLFTALNRVLTTNNGSGAYRPIAIGGTVSSFLGSRPGGLPVQGGNIWFYSPGGILATGTAAFNVGSLLLSTSDIASVSRQRDHLLVNLTGIAPGHPDARVALAAGSQVNLPRPQSSLAIFSPTIEQGGTVAVNGSVSYVSGNSGRLELYDSGRTVAFVSGAAGAGNQIVHTGTTTGPAAMGASGGLPVDSPVIEFLGGTNVGVLLSGNIGYAPATSAQVLSNGSIRLDAGTVTATGDVTLGADTAIYATEAVNLMATSGTRIATGSDVNGGYDLTILAPAATLRAEAGGVIDIAGSLTLADRGGAAELGLAAAGASGSLAAGKLTVRGDLSMQSGGGALTVTGGETPLTVGGRAFLNGQSIALSFAGGGGLDAAYLSLSAPGGIAFTRTGGAGLATLRSAGDIDGLVDGSFVTGPGTMLDAGRSISLHSLGGSVDLAASKSASGIQISALGNVTIGDADTNGGLSITAGLVNLPGGGFGLSPAAVVRINGDILADTVSIDSGGFVRFSAGSEVRSKLFVRSGDDIIVERGAQLTATPGQGFPYGIELNAGAINPGQNDGDLISPITTPIASLVIGGSLDSTGGAILLSGDAIDAAGGSIVTGTLHADVTDAPSAGPFSNDAGLLGPGCAQGSVCIGMLTASGDVLIGLGSNAGLVSATLGNTRFSGDRFEINARDSLAIGLPGSGSQIVARGAIALTSLAGDITLRDAALAASTLRLAASRGSLIGNADLTSPNAIAVDVGNALSAGEIKTGDALVRGFGGTGAYRLTGDFRATRLETGGTADIAIIAGGVISLGAADPNGAGVVLTATAVDLGQTSADTAAIRITGDTIGFTALQAAGPLSLAASGAVQGGTLSAGGAVTVDAAGAISLEGLSASDAALTSNGGAITANGLAITGRLTARGTRLTLAAPGALTVEAEASAGAIAITSGGDLAVNARAPGAVTLASTGGAVAIGTIAQAQSNGGGNAPQSVGGGADVAITSAQGITIADSVTAAGALTMMAGGAVTLDGPATGQTIAITAADLVIGATGALGTANTQRIALASTRDVSLGTGATGGFAVDSAEFGRIRNGGDLLITALGTQGGGGNLSVQGLAIDAGSQIGSPGLFALTATGGALFVAGDLAIRQGGGDTRLSLKGDTVNLDYATAALAVLDAGGNPIGQMLVDGRIITSLSDAARTAIVGRTPDEISLRLGQADVIRTTPLFRTNALTLTAVDAILIQNSGTGNDSVDRRGLTVGSLAINGAPDGHTLVIINGIVGNLTGIDAARLVTFNSPIAPGSTVNGCALGNIQSCALAVVLAPQSILIGTPNLIKDEEEEASEVEDGVADGRTDAPPIDTQKIDDPAGSPMIDDPVTGAGNEDLWQPPEG